MLRLRDKLLPLVDLKSLLGFDGGLSAGCRPRLHRRDAGRPPDLRHRGRFGVPHRGNRGQADVEQAAPHPAVLGQHHSGRRIGDPDHRSQRRGAGERHDRGAARGGRCGVRGRDDRRREAPPESLLVFRAGSPQPKAVPLSLVTRLEMIDAGKIEVSSAAGRSCSTAASSCRSCRRSRRLTIKTAGRSAAAGVLRSATARWRCWSTRSSTSSKRSSRSSWRARGPASSAPRSSSSRRPR